MALLGIDEVGRGPLAGPLVIGAVILPGVDKAGMRPEVGDVGMRPEIGDVSARPEWVAELRDSKKLSAKKREKLSEILWREATCGLGWVSPMEIDEMGIAEALRLAARRAVEEVQKSGVSFSQIVIDGKVNFLAGTRLEKYVSTVVKGDDLIKEVSAASIIAKHARDEYMVEVGKEFPEYGFSSHVGYGTAKHIKAISEYGVCPEHRKSFEPIRSMLGYERKKKTARDTTSIGARGEEAVCEYLTRAGHEICARNFKTYYCEIDVISVCNGKIYFTEVKTRKDGLYGGGFGAIDGKKRRQIEFAAEYYLHYHREMRKFDPLLAAASVNGDFEVEDWFTL
ncbi:ribonuclease HII [Candidatus Saccharibacteria bacterium]|nr:ribonuclease HII [Candidatus Saccharibacteria bacterium]